MVVKMLSNGLFSRPAPRELREKVELAPKPRQHKHAGNWRQDKAGRSRVSQGTTPYFKEGWNIFDFVIVVGGLFDLYR